MRPVTRMNSDLDDSRSQRTFSLENKYPFIDKSCYWSGILLERSKRSATRQESCLVWHSLRVHDSRARDNHARLSALLWSSMLRLSGILWLKRVAHRDCHSIRIISWLKSLWYSRNDNNMRDNNWNDFLSDMHRVREKLWLRMKLR